MLWPSLMILGTAGLLWAWHARPQQRRSILTVIAVACLGFQVAHMGEHLAQAVVWITAPTRPPFLTPWAELGAAALTLPGHPGSGDELLHLAGNLVFLAGLIALAVLAPRRPTSLTAALAIQAIHVAEHLALTVSAVIAGRAIGLTTGFGTLDPGPILWSFRVNAHLALNTAATLFAAVAVTRFLRGRSAGRLGDEGPTRPPTRVSAV